jgi:hypothetical protein
MKGLRLISEATAYICEGLRKLEITTETIKATTQQTHKNTISTWTGKITVNNT